MPPDRPIFFSPRTYARHAAAVRRLESEIRTRSPRPGDSRSRGVSPGAWGRLASGGTITAASGLTLGAGDVKLCDRSGIVFPENETVRVYNAGAAITASGGDKIVALEWVDGEWSACGCEPGCDVTITGFITGCNSLGPPGVLVEAHDSTAGGAVLGSMTTTGSAYTLNISGATEGNDIVIVMTHSRFATATVTLTHTTGTVTSTKWKCGSTTAGVNKTLTPASGYHCLAGDGCALPKKDTLYLTHSILGSWTINWVSGSKWQGTRNHFYPGCAGSPYCSGTACPAKTLPITMSINGGAVVSGQFTYPFDFSTFCPDPAGAGSAAELYDTPVITCSPFNLSLTAFGSTVKRCLYCGNPSPAPTMTVTE